MIGFVNLHEFHVINLFTSNLTWLGCQLLGETLFYPKIFVYQIVCLLGDETFNLPFAFNILFSVETRLKVIKVVKGVS